jgi:hypothetical protein
MMIAPLVLYIGGDAGTRVFLSGEPSVIHASKSAGQFDRSVFYVGGASSSTVAQSAGLVPMLSQEGEDVYVLENAPDLFNADKVIDLIIRTIKDYDEVIFIAGSMGGLIVYDTIAKLRAADDDRHFGVLLIDSPTGWDDVIGVSTELKILSILPLGWTTNQWFPSTFDRNAPAVIDNDANRNLLENLWVSYETWNASSSSDQGRYVLYHDPMIKLEDVSWYFIQSGADTFVGKTAYDNWVLAQGPMLKTEIKDSAHLALLNRPTLYNKAIRTAIDHVGIPRPVQIGG